MTTFLRTTLVDESEFWTAYNETGGIYFIRDDQAEQIKIGHTRDDPWRRLSNLQVGNSNRLRLVGLIAAEQAIERHIHFVLMEGRTRGEWFSDRGVTTQWLMDMTRGEPLFRHVWRLVKGLERFTHWDPKTNTHTMHYWDADVGQWVPPIPEEK